MARWIFVRHAESTANAARWLAGRRDVPLSATGRGQLEGLSRRLGGVDWERAVTSPLQRARDTAAALTPDAEVVTCLAERDLGVFEGLARDVAADDGAFDLLTSWTGRPEGGESLVDVALRGVAWLAEAPEVDTLVVAHGGVIRAVVGLLDGRPEADRGRWKVANTGVLEREVPPGRWGELLRSLGPHVWLASGSPRRRQLLRGAGVRVRVRPVGVDEAVVAGEPPVAYARRLAREKAHAAPPGVVALAADTVVHIDGEVLDKPVDRSHARRHLERLSGRWHRVTTGVCVRRGPTCESFVVTTDVRFRELGRAEIQAYLDSGEADDKAGAYGIQGLGGALVAEVRGSWTNVMGLPLEETLKALEQLRTQAPQGGPVRS